METSSFQKNSSNDPGKTNADGKLKSNTKEAQTAPMTQTTQEVESSKSRFERHTFSQGTGQAPENDEQNARMADAKGFDFANMAPRIRRIPDFSENVRQTQSNELGVGRIGNMEANFFGSSVGAGMGGGAPGVGSITIDQPHLWMGGSFGAPFNPMQASTPSFGQQSARFPGNNSVHPGLVQSQFQPQFTQQTFSQVPQPTAYPLAYSLPVQSVVTILVQSPPTIPIPAPQMAPLPYGVPVYNQSWEAYLAYQQRMAQLNQVQPQPPKPTQPLVESAIQVSKVTPKTEDKAEATDPPKHTRELSSTVSNRLVQKSTTDDQRRWKESDHKQLFSTVIIEQQHQDPPPSIKSLKIEKTESVCFFPAPKPPKSAAYSQGGEYIYLNPSVKPPPKSESYQLSTGPVFAKQALRGAPKSETFKVSSHQALSQKHVDNPRYSQCFKTIDFTTLNGKKIEIPKKSSLFSIDSIPLMVPTSQHKNRTLENLRISDANTFVRTPQKKPKKAENYEILLSMSVKQSKSSRKLAMFENNLIKPPWEKPQAPPSLSFDKSKLFHLVTLKSEVQAGKSWRHVKVINHKEMAAFCHCLTPPQGKPLCVEAPEADGQVVYKFGRLKKLKADFYSFFGREPGVFESMMEVSGIDALFIREFKNWISGKDRGLFAVVLPAQGSERMRVILVLLFDDQSAWEGPSASNGHRDLVRTLVRLTPSHTVSIKPEDAEVNLPTLSQTPNMPPTDFYRVQERLPEPSRCEAQPGKSFIPKQPVFTIFGKGSQAGYFIKNPIKSATTDLPTTPYKSGEQYGEFARTHQVKLKENLNFTISVVEKFISEKMPSRLNKIKKEVEAERQKIDKLTDGIDPKLWEEKLLLTRNIHVIQGLSALCPKNMAFLKENSAKRSPEFKQKFAKALKEVDRFDKEFKPLQPELESVLANFMFDSDKRSIDKYAQEKMINPATVQTILAKPKKACIQELYGLVNKSLSQSTLDGRRKSVTRAISLEDINNDLKAIKAKPEFGQASPEALEADSFNLWDAFESRIAELQERGKALDKMKLTFKEEQERDFKRSLFREELRRMLESANEMEPVIIVGIKAVKSERIGAGMEYELTYENPDQPETGSETNIFRFEPYKRKGSDVSLSDVSATAAVAVGERFVHKIQLQDKLALGRVLLLKTGLHLVFLEAGKKTEIRLFDRLKFGLIEKLVFEGKVLACDASGSRNGFDFLLSDDKGVWLKSYLVDDSRKFKEEGTIDLSKTGKLSPPRDLAVTDNGDIYLLTEDGSVKRVDSKTKGVFNVEVLLKDIKRVLSAGDSQNLVFVVPNKIYPYSIERRQMMAPIDIHPETDLVQTALILVNDQILFLSTVKGKIHTQVLTFFHSKDCFEVVASAPVTSNGNSGSHPPPKMGVFDYYGHIPSFADRPGYGPKADQNKAPVSLTLYPVGGPIADPRLFEKNCVEKLRSIDFSPGNWFLKNIDFWGGVRIQKLDKNAIENLSQKWQENDLQFVIQEILGLVPICVSGVQGNDIVLYSNDLPVSAEGVKDVFDLQSKLDFGHFSGWMAGWAKPVVVISHRSGSGPSSPSIFEGLFPSTPESLKLAPDACLMNVVADDNTMYVLLKFEGDSTAETSHQADLIKSTISSVTSDMTIMETDQVWNGGEWPELKGLADCADLFRGCPQAYQGVLSIVLKHPDPQQLSLHKSKILESISKRVEKEKQNNFVSKMYSQGFQINFGRNDDKNSGKIDEFLLKRSGSRFLGGNDFEVYFKMVLARLALQDFTNLKDQELFIRMNYLRSNIDHALKFGQLNKLAWDRTTRRLASLDDPSDKVDSKFSFDLNAQPPSKESVSITYKDTDLSFGGTKAAPLEAFEITVPRSPYDHQGWHNQYKEFVRRAVKGRQGRVKSWIDLNLKRFVKKKANLEILRQFNSEMSRLIDEFGLSLEVCRHKCAKCFAICTQFYNHKSDHSCGSRTHDCLHNCEYCVVEAASVKRCHLPFGHGDKHACEDPKHICRERCRLESCRRVCRAQLGHSGPHDCGSAAHECTASCSAPNCSRPCSFLGEKEHTVHACTEDRCSQTCEIDGCNLRCSVNDHFHLSQGLADTYYAANPSSTPKLNSASTKGVSQKHLCQSQHPCREECHEPGLCKRLIERKLQDIEFVGERGHFRFQKYFEMKGIRLKCIEVIPPGMLAHPGEHVHTESEVAIHTCDVKCPTCGSLCELQIGHEGRHNTMHKNMENCHLVSDQKNIDIGDHQYVAGESTEAEMCHIFCKRLGRGHIHLAKCGKTATDCPNVAEGQRIHETKQYGPDFGASKDELTHEAYWEKINFEDPCTEADREVFKKCSYYCGAEEHGTRPEDRQYCQLDMWHSQATRLSDVGRSKGWLTRDGHYFVCEHKQTAKNYHFVLCLDDSGSMNGKPWEDLSEAVKNFALSRLVNKNDKITIIQFNDMPVVMCENIHFENFDVHRHLKFRAGGTEFGVAIQRAHEIIKNHLHEGLTPVFIFMSDGKSTTGELEMTALATEFNPKGLKVYTIAFDTFSSGASVLSEKGRKADVKLRKLAALASGIHLSSITGLQLKEHFMEISSAFRTTIGVMSSI
jgi:hypothetical protein